MNMKQRTNTYLGSFVNNDGGNSSYRLMIKHIRQVVNGGRFVKMYRGNSRPFWIWPSQVKPEGFKCYSGSSRKEGASHFDVYFLRRGNSEPSFYNFKLV